MKAPIILIIVASVFLGGVAQAQQPPPPPKPREGKAEFAFVTTRGNASTQSIAAAGQLTFRPPQWVVEGQAAFVRNEADEVVNAKSLAARGRVSRVLTARLQLFGQHSYLRDLFSGVEHRNNTEGGLAYLVVEAGRHTLFADLALGYLNESRTTGTTLTTPTAGTGARYKLRLSDTSDLTEDVLFSFDLKDEGTWRVNQALALTAAVVSILSVKISNVIRFVDEPVPGFEQTDAITSAALVVSF